MGNKNTNERGFNEEEFDSVISELLRHVRVSDKPRVVNPDRIEEIKWIHRQLQLNVRGNSRIKVHFNEPVTDMSYISIIGKDIELINGIYLKEIFEIADNLEIYPNTNGNITMNIGFYNTTQEVD